MRVICPWCFDDENLYRTSAELLKHVDKKHIHVTEEVKRGEFFSEKNGFWLAIKPGDYLHLMKPTDHGSTIAIQARSAVGRWLDKGKKKLSRTREQWTSGWDLAKPKEQEPSRRSYSPSRPLIPEARLKLVNVELSSKGHAAYFIDEGATIGDVWYKAELCSDVMGDTRASEGLLRRLRVNTRRTIPCNFTSLARDCHGITRAAARELGISERFIERVFRQIVSFSVTTTTKKRSHIQCLADELGVEDDVEIIEPEKTEQKKKKSRKDKSPQKNLKSKTPPTKEKSNKEEKPKEKTPRSNIETRKETITSPETPTKAPAPIPETSDSMQATIFQQALEKLITPIKTPPPQKQHPIEDPIKETVVLPIAPPKTPEMNTIDLDQIVRSHQSHRQKRRLPSEIVVSDEDQPTPCTSDVSTTTSESACQIVPSIASSMESAAQDDEIAEERDQKTLQERARDLLATGVMPLLPPARREWVGVEPIELHQPDRLASTQFEQYSADEKLTAWSYTAMALEFNRGVPLVYNETDLLDRYAFLGLPGTRVPTTDKTNSTRLRLENYNILRDIVQGKLKEKDACQWIEVFEAAQLGADESTLHIVKKIRHVPLRLSVDDSSN